MSKLIGWLKTAAMVITIAAGSMAVSLVIAEVAGPLRGPSCADVMADYFGGGGNTVSAASAPAGASARAGAALTPVDEPGSTIPQPDPSTATADAEQTATRAATSTPEPTEWKIAPVTLVPIPSLTADFIFGTPPTEPSATRAAQLNTATPIIVPSSTNTPPTLPSPTPTKLEEKPTFTPTPIPTSTKTELERIIDRAVAATIAARGCSCSENADDSGGQ